MILKHFENVVVVVVVASNDPIGLSFFPINS